MSIPEDLFSLQMNFNSSVSSISVYALGVLHLKTLSLWGFSHQKKLLFPSEESD